MQPKQMEGPVEGLIGKMYRSVRGTLRLGTSVRYWFRVNQARLQCGHPITLLTYQLRWDEVIAEVCPGCTTLHHTIKHIQLAIGKVFLNRTNAIFPTFTTALLYSLLEPLGEIGLIHLVIYPIGHTNYIKGHVIFNR